MLLCYARGLEKRREDPALAARAEAGELPVLPWRGGVEKALRSGVKLGSMYYLAMWHGLRGENLAIDVDTEQSLTCSATGQQVLFVPDLLSRLRAREGVDDDE